MQSRLFAVGSLVIAFLASAASAVPVTYDIKEVIVAGSTVGATTGTIDVTFSGPAGTTVGGYDLDVFAEGLLTITGYTTVTPYTGTDAFNFTDFGGGEYGVGASFASPEPTLTGSPNVVGRFSFSVPAGVTGTFDLTWGAAFTSGMEANNTPYTLTLTDGSVTVAAAAVPEPATVAVLGLLTGAGLLARGRRGALQA